MSYVCVCVFIVYSTDIYCIYLRIYLGDMCIYYNNVPRIKIDCVRVSTTQRENKHYDTFWGSLQGFCALINVWYRMSFLRRPVADWGEKFSSAYYYNIIFAFLFAFVVRFLQSTDYGTFNGCSIITWKHFT